MPIVRKTKSLLGKSIVNDVTDFIYQNALAMNRDINLSSKDGAEALSNAICYAISKALANGKVKIAFDLGVVPSGGGVPGILIYNGLKSQVVET